MSTKPETRYYTAIHKLLPKGLHREKMNNPYRSGTADVWYSGNDDDLWVEYKFITKVPKQAPIWMDKMLSPLQMDWLERRYLEGRNVVVILGSPDKGYVFETPKMWQDCLLPDELRERGLTKQQVADYIWRRTML